MAPRRAERACWQLPDRLGGVLAQAGDRRAAAGAHAAAISDEIATAGLAHRHGRACAARGQGRPARPWRAGGPPASRRPGRRHRARRAPAGRGPRPRPHSAAGRTAPPARRARRRCIGTGNPPGRIAGSHSAWACVGCCARAGGASRAGAASRPSATKRGPASFGKISALCAPASQDADAVVSGSPSQWQCDFLTGGSMRTGIFAAAFLALLTARAWQRSARPSSSRAIPSAPTASSSTSCSAPGGARSGCRNPAHLTGVTRVVVKQGGPGAPSSGWRAGAQRRGRLDQRTPAAIARAGGARRT